MMQAQFFAGKSPSRGNKKKTRQGSLPAAFEDFTFQPIKPEPAAWLSTGPW
jgi:hypothetical protein